MHRFRPGPLLLFCLFCSVSASAQQPTSTTPPPTSDPQAVALVQRSLAALTGGVAITDVTLTGSAHRIAGSDDETGTATLEASAAGDSKVSLNFPSGARTEIRNHSSLPLPGSLPSGAPAEAAQMPQVVGAWVGPDGSIHPMAGHNVMTDAAWFFPALTLERLAASQSYILAYVGQETHDGVAVLHISAVQPYSPPPGSGSATNVPLLEVPPAQLIAHLSQMDLFIDPNSLLPIALDFNQHPDNNALLDIPVEIRFSGYQSNNGVAVPMHVQKYLNNVLALDLQFTSAATDSGLSSSAFAIQ
jgi:hypothetical protein